MDFNEFPSVPPLLLKALQLAFPEKSPGKTESLEDLRWRGGQRDVVRFLQMTFENQQKTRES